MQNNNNPSYSILPREKNYTWATWVATPASGDRTCHYEGWFKTHMASTIKQNDNVQLRLWTAQHAGAVQDEKNKLQKAGYAVRVERQNKWKLQGATTTLAGQVDLIAEKPGECLIIEVKTGRPRNADIMQAGLYMWAHAKRNPKVLNGRFDGRVVYATYPEHTTNIPWSVIDKSFEENIVRTINIFAAPESPEPEPSFQECRFCSLSVNECKARQDDDDDLDAALVANF